MSAQIIPLRAFVASDVIRALLREPRLSPAARAVGIALASRANAQGEAWPQTRRLAEDAALTPTSARRAVRELVAAGIISERELEAGEVFPNGRAAPLRARITRFQVSTAGEVAAAMKSAPRGAQAQQSVTRTAGPKTPQIVAPAVQTDSRRSALRVRTDSANPPTLDSGHLIGRSRSEFDPTNKQIPDLAGYPARTHASGRAGEPAPSAFGASRAPSAQPQTERLKSSHDDRTDAATVAACRVLAAVRPEAETHPAMWIAWCRDRLDEGFSQAQLVAAIHEAKRAPWYREHAGRQTPGFVLSSPDRCAALAELAARKAPAARIVAAVQRAENLAAHAPHETLAEASRLLASLDAPDHAPRRSRT